MPLPNQPSINLSAKNQSAGPVVRGSIYIFAPANAVTTVTPGVGVFIPIGTGNPGTHPLYLPSADGQIGFTVVGGTAPSQLLQYDGPGDARCYIAWNVAQHSTFFASQDVAGRVLKNGAPITQTVSGTEAFGPFLGNSSNLTPVDVSPGDTFQLEVANISGGSDLFVDAASLTIFGTAVP